MGSTDSSQHQIMCATHTALCKHGYADLTFDKIAEEFEKSKSLIAYHYDTKDDLLVAFLEYLTTEVETRISELSSLPSDKRLDALLEMGLALDEEDTWTLRIALLEMRAQAPYNDRFADQFKAIDDILTNAFSVTLNEMDTDHSADLVLSAIDGYMNRKITMNDKNGREQFKETLLQLLN